MHTCMPITEFTFSEGHIYVTGTILGAREMNSRRGMMKGVQAEKMSGSRN